MDVWKTVIKADPTDLLFDIVTRLGIKDSPKDDAINIVVAKQDETGKWNAENT